MNFTLQKQGGTASQSNLNDKPPLTSQTSYHSQQRSEKGQVKSIDMPFQSFVSQNLQNFISNTFIDEDSGESKGNLFTA